METARAGQRLYYDAVSAPTDQLSPVTHNTDHMTGGGSLEAVHQYCNAESSETETMILRILVIK